MVVHQRIIKNLRELLFWKKKMDSFGNNIRIPEIT